jgi:hypothetical protein
MSDDDRVRLYPSAGVGKHEISWGAGRLPIPQGIGDKLAKGHDALASGGFGFTDLLVAIGSLPDVDLVGLEVYVGPAKSAKFGSAQAGESGRDK